MIDTMCLFYCIKITEYIFKKEKIRHCITLRKELARFLKTNKKMDCKCSQHTNRNICVRSFICQVALFIFKHSTIYIHFKVSCFIWYIIYIFQLKIRMSQQEFIQIFVEDLQKDYNKVSQIQGAWIFSCHKNLSSNMS